MRWVFGIALLALAGCQTQPVHEMSYSQQQEWAQGIVQSCRDQGVADSEMEACVRAESMRDAALRHRNAQNMARARNSLSAGMQAQANSYNRAAAATASRNINCRSIRAADGAIRTQCN